MTKIKQFIKKYEKMPVVARASLWFVICGFMTRGVSLLTTPIFTRLLTTEQYGVYSVFNSWLEIVTIFASLKLGYGVYIQGLVKFNDDQDRFSSSLLGLATTWCGGVFLIYLLFHKTFNSLLGLETPMMVCMFIMVISTVALDFWSARKRNEFKYATLVKVTMFIVVMKPVLGIIAVLLTMMPTKWKRVLRPWHWLNWRLELFYIFKSCPVGMNTIIKSTGSMRC